MVIGSITETQKLIDDSLKLEQEGVELNMCKALEELEERGREKGRIEGISLEDGGFVCHDCLSLHDKQLDKVTLKAFRHINKLTIDSIDQLKVPDESIDLLMEIMDYYVDEMTGILFKTKKMIQSLSKI